MTKSTVQYIAQIKKEMNMRFILDSGAFTAWNTGKIIVLDEYCKFIDSLPFKPDYIVQLDVFGDSEKTYENLQIMLKRGYKVMPVFTRGDSKARLEEFYQLTDYIMFGGIVIGGKNKNYVKWFMEQNGSRKCHWLGFVKMEFIKHYKPESADSSSLISAEKFANLSIYAGFGDLKTYKKHAFIDGNPLTEQQMKIGHIHASEVLELKKEAAWKPNKIATDLNFRAHILRSIEVEERLGTKIYLALATKQKLETAVKQFKGLIS